VGYFGSSGILVDGRQGLGPEDVFGIPSGDFGAEPFDCGQPLKNF
jgi:hypothetical protein